jgi:hypothetical protein
VSPDPDADNDLTSVCNTGGAASSITFKDSSISLQDVLTPPPAKQERSAILGTVQLIVSQLRLAIPYREVEVKRHRELLHLNLARCPLPAAGPTF